MDFSKIQRVQVFVRIRRFRLPASASHRIQPGLFCFKTDTCRGMTRWAGSLVLRNSRLPTRQERRGKLVSILKLHLGLIHVTRLERTDYLVAHDTLVAANSQVLFFN